MNFGLVFGETQSKYNVDKNGKVKPFSDCQLTSFSSINATLNWVEESNPTNYFLDCFVKSFFNFYFEFSGFYRRIVFFE